MNKKLPSLLFCVVLLMIGGVGIYLLKNHLPLPVLPVAPNPTPPPNQTPSSTVSIWVPVDVFGNPVGVQGKSFINTSTKVVVSFGNEVKDDGGHYGSVD